MRLTLVRHGETTSNASGIIQGQLPGELSALGISQAGKVAERLKGEKFDYIFASDLARAADTAKVIAGFHEGVPFELTESLREIGAGELEGKPKPDNWSVAKYDLDFGKSIGREGWDELHKRAGAFLDEIISKFQGKSVLLVGHNQINQALILNLLGEPWEKVKEMGKLGNTSVSEFEVGEDGDVLEKVFDCTRHLE